MRRSGLALVSAGMLVLAGCTQGGDGAATGSPTPAPAPSSAATTTGRSQCTDLVVSGQTLVTTVSQFVGGQATGDQVRAAAAQLSDAMGAARSVIGPETSARLDDAQRALAAVGAALTAQPPDLAGTRTAANDALTALRAAATICQTDTGAPAPTTSP
jgi:hypothetical protein